MPLPCWATDGPETTVSTTIATFNTVANLRLITRTSPPPSRAIADKAWLNATSGRMRIAA